MNGAVHGSCYGFRPVSDLGFEYLRGGDGERFAVYEHDAGEEATAKTATS